MAKKKSVKAEKESKTSLTNIQDIEKIVVDLANKGNSPSQIGIILKNEHGIDDIKLLSKKITKILKDNNITYKTDLDFVSEKLKRIEDHFSKNRQDKRAKREVVRYVARKRSISKYVETKNLK